MQNGVQDINVNLRDFQVMCDGHIGPTYVHLREVATGAGLSVRLSKFSLEGRNLHLEQLVYVRWSYKTMNDNFRQTVADQAVRDGDLHGYRSICDSVSDEIFSRANLGDSPGLK